MIDTPQILQTEAQAIAIVHITTPRAEMRNVMGPGLMELRATLAAQGLVPLGPWFTHHLKMDPGIFDFEIGLPIDGPVTPAGRVTNGVRPASTVARTIYHGPYESLGAAWGEFEAWIAAHGHTSAPDLWETYLTGPESGPDSAAYRTELTRPLAR